MKTTVGNIKGKLGLTFMLLFLSSTIFAQSIEDGKRQIDYMQYKGAKNIFSKVLKQNPTDSKTFFWLGESYFLLGNLDSAMYYFDNGIKTEYDNPYNHVGAGMVGLMKNNQADAQKGFGKAISINKSKDAYVYVLLADAYIKSKDFDQALIYLGKAKAIDKMVGEIYIKYADIFMAQNKAGDALTQLERATDLNKNFAKAYYYIGYINSMTKNATTYSEAKKAFQAVMTIDSNYVPMWKELAELEFAAGKYELMARDYKKYISIADYTLEDRIRYASALFLNKEYESSTKEIDAIFKIDSSNVILKRLLAYSSYETGDYAKGLNYINKFFEKIEPDKIIAQDYVYKAKLLLKTGQDSLAILSFQKAVEKDSSQYEVWSDAAKEFDKQKKFKYSIIAYNKLIEKRPEPMSQDFYPLGRAYYFSALDPKLDSNAVKDLYIKADTCFGKVIELKKDSYLGYVWKGRTQQALEPTMAKGLARPYYEKVLELTESTKDKRKVEIIEANTYLGRFLYYIKQDKPGSKVYWEKVKELDPANKEADDILKKIK